MLATPTRNPATLYTAESVASNWPDEPINPKVEPLVRALNGAGIYTVLSGDLYGDDLVYVDLHMDQSLGMSMPLPEGWLAGPNLWQETEHILGIGGRRRRTNWCPPWPAHQTTTRIARLGGAVTGNEAREVTAAVVRHLAQLGIEFPIETD